MVVFQPHLLKRWGQNLSRQGMIRLVTSFSNKRKAKNLKQWYPIQHLFSTRTPIGAKEGEPSCTNPRSSWHISLCLDPLFWECIPARMHSWECILYIMHFAENSTFGKILKLFIRNDYAKKIVFDWYFKECILPIK